MQHLSFSKIGLIGLLMAVETGHSALKQKYCVTLCLGGIVWWTNRWHYWLSCVLQTWMDDKSEKEYIWWDWSVLAWRCPHTACTQRQSLSRTESCRCSPCSILRSDSAGHRIMAWYWNACKRTQCVWNKQIPLCTVSLVLKNSVILNLRETVVCLLFALLEAVGGNFVKLSTLSKWRNHCTLPAWQKCHQQTVQPIWHL